MKYKKGIIFFSLNIDTDKQIVLNVLEELREHLSRRLNKLGANEKDIIELMNKLGVEIGENGRIRFITEEENEEEFEAYVDYIDLDSKPRSIFDDVIVNEEKLSELSNWGKVVCVLREITGHSEEFIKDNLDLARNNFEVFIFECGKMNYFSRVLGEEVITDVVINSTIVYRMHYSLDPLVNDVKRDVEDLKTICKSELSMEELRDELEDRLEAEGIRIQQERIKREKELEEILKKNEK